MAFAYAWISSAGQGARGLRRAAGVAAIAVAGAAANAQSITNLGALDPGHQFAMGTAVSADGSVVAGISGENFFQSMRAVRWSGGALIDLGAFPESVNMVATAVSADGAWLAGSGFGQSSIAFRWSQGAGLENLGTIPGGAWAEAAGISGDGSVVVGTGGSKNGDQAFRWTAGKGMQGLGTLPGGVYSFGTGVSADAKVVTGISATESGELAFTWTEQNGMQALPAVDVEFAGGLAISSDGSVIAGYSGAFAARWVAGAPQSLGGLDAGTFSVCYALSGDGLTAGGMGDNADGNVVATIWTESLGLVDLNTYLPSIGVDLTGWVLLNTTGISFDGTTLVGDGFYNGVERGWLVTIPAPAPAGLFGLATLMAAHRRRRR